MVDKSGKRSLTASVMRYNRRLLPLERVGAIGSLHQRFGRALLLWAVSAALFWTVFNVDFGLTHGAHMLYVVVLFMGGIYTGFGGLVALVTGAPLSTPRV